MPFDRLPLFALAKRQKAAKRSAVKWRGMCLSVTAAMLLAGCAAQNGAQLQPAGLTAPKKNINAKTGRRYGARAAGQQISYSGRLTERRCLERAMFFESNRSSREGLVAVGTVVMNRVHSSQYPNTICGVVGQKNQFAPGVLTRPMNAAIVPDIAAVADAVLRGERSPKLKSAMFFHTAGMRFPYNNMHYVLVAGGNSFYEKRGRDGRLSTPVNDETYDVAYAFAQDRGELAPASAMLDGAVSGATDSVAVASVSHSPRAQLLQVAYRPEHENTAAAANASLATVYDRADDGRALAERSRANEAQAEMASYSPDSVPVPQLKAVYQPQSEASGQAQPAPHFMPISAPQSADNSAGLIRETGADARGASVSYKAPNAEKAGEIGAMLLNGKP